MGANSLVRRVLKKALHPILNERTYQMLQCAAMAWDIRSGAWVEPELDLVRLGIRPGETAIDIGANYGLYSYHMSRAVGASGRVLAFEPVPFTCATFRLVARLLGFRNVELMEKGCADREGTVTFALPLQASGAIAAGLVHMSRRDNNREGREQHARFEGTREITCPVCRIDDVVSPPGDVSFIKADIEGAELWAFRGAESTIDRFRPTVLSEITPWFLEGFGIGLDELLGFFAKRGYDLFWYDDEARRLVPRSSQQVVEDNYLFLHPSRKDRFARLL